MEPSSRFCVSNCFSCDLGFLKGALEFPHLWLVLGSSSGSEFSFFEIAFAESGRHSIISSLRTSSSVPPFSLYQELSNYLPWWPTASSTVDLGSAEAKSDMANLKWYVTQKLLPGHTSAWSTSVAVEHHGSQMVCCDPPVGCNPIFGSGRGVATEMGCIPVQSGSNFWVTCHRLQLP